LVKRSGIVERYIVFKNFGSIKERIQSSTGIGHQLYEMGTGQRPIICQVVALCSSREVCRKGLCI